MLTDFTVDFDREKLRLSLGRLFFFFFEDRCETLPCERVCACDFVERDREGTHDDFSSEIAAKVPRSKLQSKHTTSVT